MILQGCNAAAAWGGCSLGWGELLREDAEPRGELGRQWGLPTSLPLLAQGKADSQAPGRGAAPHVSLSSEQLPCQSSSASKERPTAKNLLTPAGLWGLNFPTAGPDGEAGKHVPACDPATETSPLLAQSSSAAIWI